MRLSVTVDVIRLLPQLPFVEREFAPLSVLRSSHSARMDSRRSRRSPRCPQFGNVHRQPMGSRSR